MREIHTSTIGDAVKKVCMEARSPAGNIMQYVRG